MTFLGTLRGHDHSYRPVDQDGNRWEYTSSIGLTVMSTRERERDMDREKSQQDNDNVRYPS